MSKVTKAVWTLLAFVFVFLFWQLLSSTVFKENQALPPPAAVISAFFKQLGRGVFYKGVFSTLLKSLISFLIAFALGIVLAVTAKLSQSFKYFIDPIVSILRSVPTLGVTFIFLIFFPGTVTAVVVGMLVTMPLVYSQLYSALVNIDPDVTEMAKVYNVPLSSRIKDIYIPQCSPYIFASVLGGFGLNLKVVLAAEIISIPRLALGSYLNGAYVSGDFTMLFCYVLTAIILNFLCEGIIKLIGVLCMPHKYGARKKIAAIFKRSGQKKEKGGEE